MEDFRSAFKDLVAMISSERDARRADSREFREFFRRIEKRMDDADERTTRFEGAMIDVLAKMSNSLAQNLTRTDALEIRQDSLEQRMSALEQRQQDQAS
ncbi:MAG: hypothetical protein FJZ00_00490 [Candidatus Sericytochromatia bacterium]|uniref:Uncharacterized protein n=1 Tax=Candidatus Tanganyikabacteria bacterium TaxID=2961651 RepID=A0A937X1L4_9BACT|nr:hypothetical protein [Candidatus Tanganyikabacteria bacterium]